MLKLQLAVVVVYEEKKVIFKNGFRCLQSNLQRVTILLHVSTVVIEEKNVIMMENVSVEIVVNAVSQMITGNGLNKY